MKAFILAVATLGICLTGLSKRADAQPSAPAKPAAPPSFEDLDLDKNASLSHEEIFLRKLAPDAAPDAKRIYVARKIVSEAALSLADANADGELSLEEFQSSAWGVEAARGQVQDSAGRIPDPIAELQRRLAETAKTRFGQYDADQSGGLNAGEWSRVNWSSDLPPMGPTPLVWWDADRSGEVTAEEFQRGLRVAFSLERPDGTPLRSEDGRIFNLNHFNSMDANHDGALSKDEFSARYHLGPEKSAERFVQLDKANTGSVTFADVHASVFGASTVDAFLNFDVNLDGRLDPEELRSRARSWQRAWLDHLLPGFDTDRDGVLTFLEFRGTPLSDESRYWNYLPNDADRDGLLSVVEFRAVKDLSGAGLSDTYFHGFDVNRDGSLSPGELPFNTVLEKLPRDLAFLRADLDKNKTLSYEEIFRQKLAPGATPAAQRSFLARQIACDSALARADRNADRELSEEEFLSSDWGIEAVRVGTQGTPGRIPDEFAEIQENLVATIKSRFSQLDASQNGMLDASEWARVNWTELAPLFASPLEWWDQDRDQQLSLDEWTRGLPVAFGFVRPDGTRLRTETGVIYNLNYFNSLDHNHDGTITLDEFKTRFYLGPEKSAERFAKIDKEGKGSLKFTDALDELFRVSVLDLFLNHDVNLDGRLDRDELLSRASPWLREWAGRVFPGFDADRDGFLSLAEFRATPLADNSTSWNYRPNDADRDGLLSPGEFRPGQELFASGLSDSYFRGFDLNRDGTLSYGEFTFTIALEKLPREVVFQSKDLDKNGKLSFAEVFPDKRPPEADLKKLRPYVYKLTRCDLAFRATDLDHSNDLSPDEFQQGVYAVSSVSEASGGPIPDPLQGLVQAVLASIFKPQAEHLSPSEWNRISWEKISPDLAQVRLDMPDRDRDGKISRDEATGILEVAFGVRLPDGFMVRLPTGHLFNVGYFDGLDANHDGMLSRSEFVTKHYSGPAAAATRFQSADVDHDGQLSRDEALVIVREDRLSTFQHFDRDLNGKISATELAGNARTWEQQFVPVVVPAFDGDQDGSLSFEEASLSPLLNRSRDWNRRRKDADNDTSLSYEEFQGDGGLYASAIGYRFFRMLDRDQDGKLSYDEMQFDMDLSKVPAEVALKVRDKDRDGKLKFEEFFTEARPGSSDQAATERYEMRLGVAETRFLADDSNHDGFLDVAEFKSSKEAALRAVERKTKALSRHQKKAPSNLPFIAFLVFDALALAGGGWYVFKRYGK